MTNPKVSGYHVREIPRGEVGEASKVFEEAVELLDAEEQGCRIMALWEMGDVVLALKMLLETKFPGMSWSDIERTADITRRVFENGVRGSKVRRTEFFKIQDPWTVEQAKLLGRSCVSVLSWRHYGTGYAVARLGDEAKFHVWHSSFIQDSSLGGIHTHRWMLESTVLLGNIENVFYRERPGHAYTRRGCGCGSGTVCEVSPTALETLCQVRIPAGWTYLSGKGTPHAVLDFESKDDLGSVTFVQKRGRDATEDAFFYLEEGTEVSPNPYETPQELTPEQLEIVQASMEKACQL